MRILALLVSLSFVVPTATAHTTVAAAGDDMCTPPHDDTTKWAPTSFQALNLKMPGAYKLTRTVAGEAAVYRAGNRVIGLQITDAGIRVPETFYLLVSATGGSSAGGGVNSLGGAMSRASGVTYDHTMESSCNAVIAGRPADITTWTWTKHAESLNNTTDPGKHYLAVIRWGGMNGLPTSYIWISSTYKTDLMSLRQIFWTVHFEGFASGAAGATARASLAAEPCRDTVPAPRGTIGDFLDTALVATLLNGITPALPRGANEMMVTFDSSGAPARIEVTSSGLADSDQARLGSIVGSNINTQPAGSVTLARVHVGLGFTGTSIQLAGVGKCARQP
jgi:hypothetical protein